MPGNRDKTAKAPELKKKKDLMIGVKLSDKKARQRSLYDMELFCFLHAFLLLVGLSFHGGSLCVGTKACSKP